MKVFIIDDEVLARKRIAELLADVPEIEEVEECSSGAIAIQQINIEKPDLLFLDINLQDMSGFEILQNIDTSLNPAVIFVTAYDFYALQAFEFNAFDFLLKPFKEDRFFAAVKKVIKQSTKETGASFEERVEQLIKLQESVHQRGSQLPKKIFIKLGNKTVFIDITKVKYICASGYYAELFTEDNKFLIRESLNKLADMLDNNNFFRIHRSTIVNLEYIQEIVHGDYSEIDIRMTDKKRFSVSKSIKQEFLKKLGLK